MKMKRVLQCVVPGIYFFGLILPVFANPSVQRGEETLMRAGQVRQKYLDLEKCTQLGNAKELCREQFEQNIENEAKILSKKRNDIVIYSWLEDAESETVISKK